MNREVLRIKKELSKDTPSEKKWFKLLDETHVHPRLNVFENLVDRPDSFDDDVTKRLHLHIDTCPECAKKFKSIQPLLQDLEKAS